MAKNKSIEAWKQECPLIQSIINYDEVFWENDAYTEVNRVIGSLPLGLNDVLEAEERLKRFAPYIAEVFPATNKNGGIIESPLEQIPSMKRELENIYQTPIEGKMLLKADNRLPISGSVKARGGIYEVLKRAEDLAIAAGIINHSDDYRKFASNDFKEFFSNYSVVCGSTGNLGLSIGIMSAMIGFKVTIHMSEDAKQWKKDLLRSKGVVVVEHADDYSKAVEEGRKESLADPNSYFIDDENSITLFLGYAVAAIRLKEQLNEQGITVNGDHPLFVYLPCGVGGGPGGITFGLKLVFGDYVHCFFAEPTHSPCMLLGLMTKEHDQISVRDFGLDNKTEADGLAVGRASGFVGKVINELISGVYTVSDDQLFVLLSALADQEGMKLEPSAVAGIIGPVGLCKNQHHYLSKTNVISIMKNATHIAWSTGGNMVPDEVWQSYYERGKRKYQEFGIDSVNKN
ncbi:D-serine ammonia-lyase [Bacillus timonensis]|uniref:D-serine ammonia-lyase n=1 Tax=Bacillus timonensis TaxID=1033734 RepID=UPI0002880397|nr:D-serine ammonia-lyase [Bacillus timonensis]